MGLADNEDIADREKISESAALRTWSSG
jgi:hypothetical protein